MNESAQGLGPFVFGLGPTIHYGAGASERSGEEMARLGARRVLVVTDPGIVEAGVPAPVIASIERAGIEVELFTGVATNPTDEHVAAAIDAYRTSGAEGLLGLGGGSSMDVAKSAAAVIANGGVIGDYEDGRRPATEPPPPLVFVPTTAGTGAEVVGGTIITDSQRRFKMHIVAVPGHVALCDPSLTHTLPPAITAATGLDALSHAVGAYVSVESQPLADAYALYAIELIGRWLPRAVQDGGDPEARHWMMIASLTAGLSMKGGGSGEHAFAHAINVLHGVHHGVGCATFLAPVMDYNLDRVADRYARIGCALGVDSEGMETGEAARAGVDAVRTLVRDLGNPTLPELGIGPGDLPGLVEYVMEDEFYLGLNPVPIGREDAQAILRTTLDE